MKAIKYNLVRSNSLDNLETEINDLAKKDFKLLTLNMHLWNSRPEEYYLVCMVKELEV